jgi:hypothetical protein
LVHYAAAAIGIMCELPVPLFFFTRSEQLQRSPTWI